TRPGSGGTGFWVRYSEVSSSSSLKRSAREMRAVALGSGVSSSSSSSLNSSAREMRWVALGSLMNVVLLVYWCKEILSRLSDTNMGAPYPTGYGASPDGLRRVGPVRGR